MEQWPVVFRSTVLFFLIFLIASQLGKRAIPTKRFAAQFSAGITIALASAMLLLTAVYLPYKLTATVSLGVLSILTAATLILKRKAESQALTKHLRTFFLDWKSNSISLVFIAICGALLYHLYISGTLGSIRTPWKFIDQPLFFGGLAALFGLAWILAWKKSIDIKPLAFSALLLLVISAGLLIFKVGYGFDPFVHRATEQHILDNGLITPKPLWYLGQHTLVVALSHITGLGINLIDKILLPALAALLIPGWLYAVAPQSWRRRMLLFLLLPIISWFVATTPQGIANLLYLILVLQLPLLHKKQLPLWVVLITTAATATLHPVAAAAGALLIVFSEISRLGISKKWRALSIAAASTLLPALFLANEWRATGIIPSLSDFTDRILSRTLFPEDISLLINSFYGLANTTYTARIIILIFAALLTAYGVKELRKRALFAPYVSTLITLFISASLLYLFNQQPLVISYEQSDYALRTLWLAGITALPFFWFGGLSFLKHVSENHTKYTHGLLIAAFVGGSIVNAYLLFPRVDKMVNHRGYSTGLSDLTAVEFIEGQNAKANNNYAVLANQSVSAAALSQIGFKREITIKGSPAYFYPIPTGGPLYEYFLQMVDETPSDVIADEVIERADLDRVYLVLNNYWWRDYRLALEAKKTADWWTTIDGGAINIFAWQHASSTQGWITPGL